MTLSVEALATIYPEQLWFELSSAAQTEAWDRAHAYSNPTARWHAYLNLLCLHPFIGYLNENPNLQQLPVTVCCNDVATDRQSWGSSVWEFVNGTALNLGQTRLAIFPQEVGTDDELCVPQEWVDIASWVADYYLAMEVNLQERWGRVWGYTTHRQLKENGAYNPIVRTYTLAKDDLIADLDILWLAREQCAPEPVPIPALPPLPPAPAKNLLVRLAKPSPGSPRLDIPFAQWGALLADDGMRKALYLRRTGELQSARLPLRRWLDLGNTTLMEILRTAGWQSDREVFGTAGAFRRLDAADAAPRIRWIKQIDLGLQSTARPFALILELTGTAEGMIQIFPQVRFLPPVDPETYLPPGLTLLAIDEDGEIFNQTQVEGDSNLINLDAPFTGAPGDKFSITLQVGERSSTEHFTI